MSQSAWTACTIVAKNRLADARVTARSLRRFHDAPFVTLLADRNDGWLDPSAEPFSLASDAWLETPALQRARFLLPSNEFSYLVTPFFLLHLVESGCSRVIFYKQETLITGVQHELLDALESHDVVVMPHLLETLHGPDVIDRVQSVLLAGAYNGGVIALRDSETTRAMLTWWCDRVLYDCRRAIDEGVHFEQRWLELAPVVFPGVGVFTKRTCNIGHWNLPERAITVVDDQVMLDGAPVSVVRFSGYTLERPELLSRHAGRLVPAEYPAVEALVERYRRALLDAEVLHWQRAPYAFATYDNGVPITDDDRRAYLAAGNAAIAFGDPRATAPAGSFFRHRSGAANG